MSSPAPSVSTSGMPFRSVWGVRDGWPRSERIVRLGRPLLSRSLVVMLVTKDIGALRMLDVRLAGVRTACALPGADPAAGPDAELAPMP